MKMNTQFSAIITALLEFRHIETQDGNATE